jgi:hypothetical protein
LKKGHTYALFLFILKMQKNKLVFLTLLIISTTGFSQGIETQTNINQVATGNDPTQVVRVFDDRYQGVQGTRLHWGNYISGRLVLTDGKVFAIKFMNYDIFSDDVIFKNSVEGAVKVLSKKNIASFQSDSLACNSDFCKFKNFDFSKFDLPTGFYAVLFEGKIKLVCKLYKTILKADYKGAYSSNQNYDRFIDEKRYYFVNKEGVPLIIKLNQKSIADIVPSHSDEIRKFIKENNYSSKNSNDLFRIFKYLDDLSK